MDLYAPRYYRDFVCIADRCRHSCCIGWEIDVDPDTMKKYAALPRGCDPDVLCSIDTEGTPHFRLVDGQRCPHLDERGLCRIILSLGEDHLCEICREHPRFYHATCHGMEVGLGMACEEACRIILRTEDYISRIRLGELEGDAATDAEFDALPYRAHLYALLSDRTQSYPARLRRIYSEFGISPARYSDKALRALLASLEYLEPTHRALLCRHYSSAVPDSDGEGAAAYAERALAYFIFRHCSDTYDGQQFLAALGACLLLERLFSSLLRETGARSLDEAAALARILSEELEYSEDNFATLTQAFLF